MTSSACSPKWTELYLRSSRERWSRFGDNASLSLTEEEVDALSGVNQAVSLSEISDVYVPLSKILYLFFDNAKKLHSIERGFLGCSTPKVPYIIGVSGSVAVGKSTTSRILQMLLSRWGDINVEIVTTDGFLFPTSVLESKDLMHRKGFPESYDLVALLQFLCDLKSGVSPINAPVYSHHSYDIIPDHYQTVSDADIVILEGLNILQSGPSYGSLPNVFVSDFLDYSIFVDAETDDIARWFLERVQLFVKGSFRDSGAYFHFLTQLASEEVVKYAERVWKEINEVNLIENILPFKYRADLILTKQADHTVNEISLRKM